MPEQPHPITQHGGDPDSCYFTGEGDMVRLVNELDWENTALGPICSWPESIRSAASIALGSTFQLVVLSGPEMIYIYNDASSSIFGAKHPWALGKAASEVWAEAWDTIGPMLHSVVDSGRALRHDDMLMVLGRHGFPEECYFTFSYSPIRGAEGITGIFISVLETSERVVNERRLRTLGELAAAVASARGALAQNLYDLPCTALYLVDADSGRARRSFVTGVVGEDSAFPGKIDLDECCVPVARAFATGTPQEFDAAGMLVAGATWPEPPRQFIAYPLRPPGACRPCGIFVAAANPRQPFDNAHRCFLDFVAGHAATAVANAEAARFEQERLDALAELARAKNAFFANASHELRTPLTLILGPLESLLASPAAQASPDMREIVGMAHRNALRMKRLVNSLLDFASIEAGRMAVQLVPSDIGELTLGLAGLFPRSITSSRAPATPSSASTTSCASSPSTRSACRSSRSRARPSSGARWPSSSRKRSRSTRRSGARSASAAPSACNSCRRARGAGSVCAAIRRPSA
ncbi:hypothetical protein D3872_01070 [Massilia cavernae]|uniref:histidine kinase n=1 Tax=Massilia cavernae TaxID=2320864 RepID=A0A418Y897_9BURK|nr:histidine kinase dimerization/phospho-acceptor domain-containing protein [Massilia cavernae]RJG27473.1 hypothetical protein D3872_01070 [Massilia cavernae]